MKLAPITIALCCVFLLLTACKKTDDSSNSNNNTNNNPTPSTPTTADLLIGAKWQESAGTATTNYMGKDTSIDIYSQLDDCDKDDFITFYSDGNCTVDENTNKCPGDDQLVTIKWALLENDTKLALVDDNPDTLDILNLTASELKLKGISKGSAGNDIIIVRTYSNIK